MAPCPLTWGELAQANLSCACIIHRDRYVREIEQYFSQTPPPKPNYIILHGQPMVGKTRILYRLSEILSDRCVPLIVTGQGSSLSNLDYFAFDLASQLTDKFNKWANLNRVPLNLSNPEWKDFEEGKGTIGFYRHWHNLQQTAGRRKTLVMFDEIEHLLDDPEKLDERIIGFLGNFVRYPDNGFFILAGSERIQFSNNYSFSQLIGGGQSIHVHYFEEETVLSFFSAIQNYFSLDNDTLRVIIALCDGHPRILQHTYEEIASLIARSPDKQRIRKDDIRPILTGVIDRTSSALWALVKRLSTSERHVIELVSQKPFDPFVPERTLECHLTDLLELANQHFTTQTIDHYTLRKGVRDLADREWIEQKNGEEALCFKLGIVPLWLRERYINLYEI